MSEIDVHPRRVEVPTAWDAVTEAIIASAIEAHSILGPGLAEKLYEAAMCHELSTRGLSFSQQRVVRVSYKGLLLPEQRLDLVVENLVVVELKAVDKVVPAFLAQLLSYMKAGEFPLGLLLNFHSPRIVDDLHRRINPVAVRARLSQPIPQSQRIGH